jgi:hypothetical protein
MQTVRSKLTALSFWGKLILPEIAIDATRDFDFLDNSLYWGSLK